jgi:hypothetical protein
MAISLFATAYAGPVQYYWHINRSEEILIDHQEHYVKQSWRNRCLIAGANGPITLTIPVELPANGEKGINSIKMSSHGNWKHVHWISIESAYKNSPYFDYYEEAFRSLYEANFVFLIDFNEALHRLFCQLLGIKADFSATTAFIPPNQVPANWHDYRDLIHPKKELAAVDPTFEIIPYYQVFQHKQGFLPNLSMFDLLFNQGPEAVFYL